MPHRPPNTKKICMRMSTRISYYTRIIPFVSHLCACLLLAILYNEKNHKARQYFSFVTPWLAEFKHPCVAIIIGFFFSKRCRVHRAETPVGLFSTTLSERLMRSWARHLLVAASSRRTDENVASRRGSGRHCRKASRARALSLSLCGNS